jgi:hypothetical protein
MRRRKRRNFITLKMGMGCQAIESRQPLEAKKDKKTKAP